MATYTLYPSLAAGEVNLAVPCPYIRPNHIQVLSRVHLEVDDGTFVGDALSLGTDYVFLSTGQLELSQAADGSKDYLVKRVTPRAPLVQQNAGAVSTVKLNLLALQVQYIAEEIDDQFDFLKTAVQGVAARVANLESGGIGGGLSALMATAQEDIPAGSPVNLRYVSGVIYAKRATTTLSSREAHGYTLAGAYSGQRLAVSISGINTAVSPSFTGPAYLSANYGYSSTDPQTGVLSQAIGVAVQGVGVIWRPSPAILL